MPCPWFTHLIRQSTMSSSPIQNIEIIRQAPGAPIRRPILSVRVDTLAQDLEDCRDRIRAMEYEIRTLRNQLSIAKSDIATMRLFMPEMLQSPPMKRQRSNQIIDLTTDEDSDDSLDDIDLFEDMELPAMFD